MWWLYLDESGDFGFDFVNSNPSDFFTVCILATSSRTTNRAFSHAVKKTLKRKLNRKRRRVVEELKATHTTLAIKKYAFNLLPSSPYGIYALTLNKRRLFAKLAENKDRVYNYVARLVIDRIPFEKATGTIHLIVDRSKGSRRIREFNDYITRRLQGRLDPSAALHFQHEDSKRWAGLQFADLFAWGVFRKYERERTDWFDVFKDRVVSEEQYL